jgi:hypothetical protein
MSSANLWLAAEVELSAANLWFVAKTELPAVNKHSLPNRVFCNEFVIRCWSWVVCSESVIRYRNCDSLPKLCRLQRISIHCRMVCSVANMSFAVEVELAAANKHPLPNRVFCYEFVIRCQSWAICSKFVIRFPNCVICSELAFAVEWRVLQLICDLLPKLSWLQRISIRCRIVCSAANLWFAAEVELSAANLWFASQTELSAAN